MTNMTSEAILKTDTQGRVQTPLERREQLLDEFERSGLSGAKFAQLVGIKYQTFATWAARRRKQRGSVSVPAKAAEPVRWLEAVVSDAKAPGSQLTTAVKVRLSTGVWLEVSQLSQVSLAAALVQALQQGSRPC